MVRNGLLIGERHYRPVSPTTLSAINSATKSVSSMLVGIAIGQGKIRSVDQTVGELLPEAAKLPASALNGLTLRQLLTQTSGLPDDGNTPLLAPDPLAYAQGLAVDGSQPPRWVYSNGGVSLISPILARATGMSMEDFARAELFAPLGIEDYEWQRTDGGPVFSWAGLKLNGRDMAKLAWTMLDHGQWRGRQVVPQDWVAASTRPHAIPSWRVAPVSDIGYGYLWFTGRIHGRPVIWGWGYGSQFAVLVPSLRLVVGTLADRSSPAKLKQQNDQVMTLVSQVVELAGRKSQL